MKHSEQRQGEVPREYGEEIVETHLQQLFRRLPMLSGFWLGPDMEVAEVVFSWTGYTAGRALYDHVANSLLQLAEECPEALELMRGRTFARAVH
jgi:hypothetical protein